ncbi:MAG: hypothetical protein GY727_15830 [Gammaproteobacteria bacterium]|nr:hypothetical protein [Gammaproteobacteria bacterium]MCP4089111.1 hypothetical protein [Gammaproteobacteria bacterium]MCP4276864.1 hypothetical protein [Gammaproteobacteria bacterium]MCP4830707.1 hypothetical protein [Gammaproteobacteria bacterium]MCP4928869.1 hypothetical protein [Gammaproteobacteria bacterium]
MKLERSSRREFWLNLSRPCLFAALWAALRWANLRQSKPFMAGVFAGEE